MKKFCKEFKCIMQIKLCHLDHLTDTDTMLCVCFFLFSFFGGNLIS